MFTRNAIAAALLGIASFAASAAPPSGIVETDPDGAGPQTIGDANVGGDVDTFAATALQIGNIATSTFFLGATTNGAGWSVNSVTVETAGTLTTPFRAYFENTSNPADDAVSLVGSLTSPGTYTFNFPGLGLYNSTLAGGANYLFSLHDFTGSVVGNVNFSVTAVPEPESYAMLLAGLGAVGFMARRRKPV